MPLQPGTTLGPYSVTAKIGEGGMGEVYAAKDATFEPPMATRRSNSTHGQRRMSVVVLGLTAALTGCQTQHVIEWPGVQMTGYTFAAGGDPTYSFVRPGAPPSLAGFSVRFPNGRVIAPHDFTIDGLLFHGAEDYDPSPSTPSPAQRAFRYLRLFIGNGQVSATFKDGELSSLTVMSNAVDSAGQEDESPQLGDRAGRRFVTLPATRDQLVELFGPPTRESQSTRSIFPQ